MDEPRGLSWLVVGSQPIIVMYHMYIVYTEYVHTNIISTFTAWLNQIVIMCMLACCLFVAVLCEQGR